MTKWAVTWCLVADSEWNSFGSNFYEVVESSWIKSINIFRTETLQWLLLVN